MMYRIRKWVYRMGFRPKPGSLLYSPSLALVYVWKDRGGLLSQLVLSGQGKHMAIRSGNPWPPGTDAWHLWNLYGDDDLARYIQTIFEAHEEYYRVGLEPPANVFVYEPYSSLNGPEEIPEEFQC